MIRIFGAAALGLGLIFSAPAFAQQAQPALSAAHQAAAEKVVGLMKPESTFEKVFPTIAQQLMQGMVAKDPNVAKELPLIIETMSSEAKANFAPMKTSMIELYGKNFTEKELTDMATFLSSPSGQSFVAKQGVLAQESAAAGQKWMIGLMPQVMGKLQQKLKDKGYKL